MLCGPAVTASNLMQWPVMGGVWRVIDMISCLCDAKWLHSAAPTQHSSARRTDADFCRRVTPSPATAASIQRSWVDAVLAAERLIIVHFETIHNKSIMNVAQKNSNQLYIHLKATKKIVSIQIMKPCILLCVQAIYSCRLVPEVRQRAPLDPLWPLSLRNVGPSGYISHYPLS